MSPKTAFTCALCYFAIGSACTKAEIADTWPGFVTSPRFDEQVREVRLASGIRAIFVAPSIEQFKPDHPTHLVIFTTPNGNTAEQTLGCGKAEGRDWHFYIQHVAAQVRQFRQEYSGQNVVLVCVQPDIRSWPTWRKRRKYDDARIKDFVDALIYSLPAEHVSVTLTGHSGGGSFMFGYLNAIDEIPPEIGRIAFLDANYNYSNEEQHGEKFVAWLQGDTSRRLLFLAYDDRNIMLNGKKVVSDTGGTYRASHRLIDWLGTNEDVQTDTLGVFDQYQSMEGRLKILIHPNPQNKILHTRLVGDMNGLHYVLTDGIRAQESEDPLKPTPSYTKWIQPDPFETATWHSKIPAFPQRRADAPTGSELVEQLAEAPPAEYERLVSSEILHGNVPDHLRKFVPVGVETESPDGAPLSATLLVLPDYLAVGSSQDSLRVPLTPQTARKIADFCGCTLPTRQLVDAIHLEATSKIEPRPLTEARESLTTFHQHHAIIEKQLAGHTPGQLVSGIKKDVVLTNRLLTKPNKVAIYGWHKLDGNPIQPLSTVHVDWYIDYSHGIRLMSKWAEVDGKLVLVKDVLKDEQLSHLLSDEGPIEVEYYD